jgi:hypothetical protein
MRAIPLLLALSLIDYAMLGVVMWVREVTKVSSEMAHPFAIEVAFFVGGLMLLVATPACGWRLARRVDESSGTIPQARVIM